MATAAAEPRSHRRLRHRRDLLGRRALRAVDRAGGSERRGRGRSSPAPRFGLLPGAVGGALVRARRARAGHVLPRRLRRAVLAADRDRRDRGRPLDRRGLRRHRRLLRRLGRLGDHATDRHHALDPRPAPRNRDRRRPRPGHLADHDRRRRHPDSDLRPAPTRLHPGDARSRLRACSALRRRAGPRAPRRAHHAELGLSGDRPGHACAGNGDHRRRRARLPRPRPAGSRHAGVGDDADEHDALPPDGAPPRTHPGLWRS